MEIKEITNSNCRYLIQTPPECDLPTTLSPATALGVRAFHRQLPGYKLTPLVRLERLVRAWGFRDIFVKDEAPRFDLKAFKVLGGSYALARLVCHKLDRPLSKVPYAQLVRNDVHESIGRITLTTATDGNHGRV
jgi:diaminopropionate ammonia-lyase